MKNWNNNKNFIPYGTLQQAIQMNAMWHEKHSEIKKNSNVWYQISGPVSSGHNIFTVDMLSQ